MVISSGAYTKQLLQNTTQQVLFSHISTLSHDLAQVYADDLYLNIMFMQIDLTTFTTCSVAIKFIFTYRPLNRLQASLMSAAE